LGTPLFVSALRRGHGEPDDADDDHAPAPEHVAEPPAEREQRGEGQQVAVDDPL
jgi:hypothetical protein